MNKHILIIAGLLIANQSFADIGATNGVPDPATCNSGVLDTESGGAALQAQYIPETINLQWYDNNTLLNVTSTNSDSCTYGTGINLPDNPTKTGYKFTGWKVSSLYDFSTLDANILGIDYAFKYANGAGCQNSPICSDLNNNEWKVIYSYGTVYGTALCSSTVGEAFQKGNPDKSSGGINCWCKATGYIPNNNNVKYRPSNNTPWVFLENHELDCNAMCAAYCAPLESITYRQMLFGQL